MVDRSISYRTLDNAATAVLRLNFKPARLTASEEPLQEVTDPNGPDYTVQMLEGGDYLVRLCYEGAAEIATSGR